MQKDKEKSKGNIIEARQRKKVDERRKEEEKENGRSRQRKQMMINKGNQRRKIKESKKESRTQTKKEAEGERESLGYSKIDKAEGYKVENYTGKERQKRIRSERSHFKSHISRVT